MIVGSVVKGLSAADSRMAGSWAQVKSCDRRGCSGCFEISMSYKKCRYNCWQLAGAGRCPDVVGKGLLLGGCYPDR